MVTARSGGFDGKPWAIAGLLISGAPAVLPDEPQPPPFHLVVHADNPTRSVDSNLLAKIFLRSIRYWPDGHQIEPVDGLQKSPLRKDSSPLAVRWAWAKTEFACRSNPEMEPPTMT